MPHEHAHTAVGRAAGQFVEQPGLAHAGIAGQQHRGGDAVGRVVEMRQQAGQLRRPAHHGHVVPP
jgi:hypothetical protein